LEYKRHFDVVADVCLSIFTAELFIIIEALEISDTTSSKDYNIH
jgi:hypothetical protein